jgi:hypothetical protein
MLPVSRFLLDGCLQDSFSGVESGGVDSARLFGPLKSSNHRQTGLRIRQCSGLGHPKTATGPGRKGAEVACQ